MARKPKDAGDFNGADPAKFDHDGNGEPGGSKPKPAVGEHEFAALCDEAFEAYDYQAERGKHDTTGRRWTFRPEKVGAGESVLWLEARRLDAIASDTISTAVVASDMGWDMIADVLRGLMGRVP